jgi:hypothetical protein
MIHTGQFPVVGGGARPTRSSLVLSNRLRADIIAASRRKLRAPSTMLQIKSNQIKSNRIESNRIESNRIESNRIESNRIESNRIESNRIETNRNESKRIESKRIELNQSNQYAGARARNQSGTGVDPACPEALVSRSERTCKDLKKKKKKTLEDSIRELAA